MMQQNITDKNSEAFQRLAWEALKKSINGLINKVKYLVALRSSLLHYLSGKYHLSVAARADCSFYTM
jgi:hypothetical protein